LHALDDTLVIYEYSLSYQRAQHVDECVYLNIITRERVPERMEAFPARNGSQSQEQLAIRPLVPARSPASSGNGVVFNNGLVTLELKDDVLELGGCEFVPSFWNGKVDDHCCFLWQDGKVKGLKKGQAVEADTANKKPLG